MKEPRIAPSSAEPAVQAGVSILVVDDDPAKVIALRSILEPLG